MRGKSLDRAGLAPHKQQYPVVECCEIGNADKQAPTHPENPGYFMHDPEYFFGMFQNLVRNHNIDTLICKRKHIGLQAMRVGLDTQSSQLLNIWQMPFQCQ